jgi:hypothetical protein
MLRIVAVALVATATFDVAYLGGKHVHAAEAVVLSLLRFIVG